MEFFFFWGGGGRGGEFFLEGSVDHIIYRKYYSESELIHLLYSGLRSPKTYVPSTENQELSKLSVGQSIATYASPTARNSVFVFAALAVLEASVPRRINLLLAI